MGVNWVYLHHSPVTICAEMTEKLQLVLQAKKGITELAPVCQWDLHFAGCLKSNFLGINFFYFTSASKPALVLFSDRLKHFIDRLWHSSGNIIYKTVCFSEFLEIYNNFFFLGF